MVKRNVWMALSVAALVLATPRTGSAGIGESIWEMSGPQFVGGGIQCKVTLHFELEICYVTVPFPVSLRTLKPKVRYRLSLEGGLTGHGEGLEWRHVRNQVMPGCSPSTR